MGVAARSTSTHSLRTTISSARTRKRGARAVAAGTRRGRRGGGGDDGPYAQITAVSRLLPLLVRPRRRALRGLKPPRLAGAGVGTNAGGVGFFGFRGCSVTPLGNGGREARRESRRDVVR